jgi:hypothetical protein
VNNIFLQRLFFGISTHLTPNRSTAKIALKKKPNWAKKNLRQDLYLVGFWVEKRMEAATIPKSSGTVSLRRYGGLLMFIMFLLIDYN